jgi:hypothetical protein
MKGEKALNGSGSARRMLKNALRTSQRIMERSLLQARLPYPISSEKNRMKQLKKPENILKAQKMASSFSTASRDSANH